MGFPLKDWIDAHPGVPHNLARSGMGPGLISARRALARPRTPDPEALRRELGRSLGVASARVFLTHGATEGNALVLQYLAHRARQHGERQPSVRWPVPEYPPLGTAALLAGFWPAARRRRPSVTVLSDPNNPSGRRSNDGAIEELLDSSRAVLVDETFREFTAAPSQSRRGLPRLWTTGTFTKVYGGDGIRVGFVVAPREASEGFAAFHGVLADELAEASVGAARALLAARDEVFAEARGLFRANLNALNEAEPDVQLEAPLWFDRPRGRDGDRLARALLRRGVLVCPGSFFGDPRGVRVCLTQPSFRADLAVYRSVRDR